MKISVITITWNSATTLRDTLNSVLNQDYPDYEYIIIDGVSVDGTVDIIREYEPKFKGRMKWISESDDGIYDAMNKGIALSSGEIVGTLNSDDFFSSPTVLTTIAQRFEKQNTIDAVYGDVCYVSRDNLSRVIRFYSSRHFRRFWMRFGFMPAHPSFYCHKSVYEKFKLRASSLGEGLNDTNSVFYNTSYKIAADFECLLRMIFVGRIKTSYIQKDFVTMRNGGVSSSGVKSHKQINKEHMRAFKENRVYSNYLFISLRYLYKIIELILGRIRY